MSLVGRYEHLPNRPKSNEARPLLEKIASQVKPIMSKRSWKVGTLAEFLPANPALLGNNMNAGERINLRLRPPGDVTTFYEYDQLVLVMLHELVHIQHGPHDAKFYKLLGELEEEYYELKRKGYSGEGFHGSGSHLSGTKVPQHIGKAKGLEAAQKRLQTSLLVGKGGLLGGRPVTGRSVREIVAEAAERRMKDDKACNTHDEGHASEVEVEVYKAQEESVGIDAKDLEKLKTKSLPADQKQPTASTSSSITKRTKPSSPTAPSQPDPQASRIIYSTASEIPRPESRPRYLPHPEQSSHQLGTPDMPLKMKRKPNVPRIVTTPPPIEDPFTGRDRPWSCPKCTLINYGTLNCEACNAAGPILENKPIAGLGYDDWGWYCHNCAAGPRDLTYWSCGECGMVRRWG